METTRLIPPDAPRPGGRASRPPFDAGLAKAQGADQVISLGEGGEEPRARCALWWKDTPVVNGANIGYIGHYAAVDSAAASALLEQACRVLAEYGAALAIGPLDGTTWRPHRLAIDGLNRPPFFMEPRNPADWPQHFLENGFHILANYSSSVVDLTRPLENTTAFDRVRRRLTGQNGIVVRPVDPERIDQELCGIYRLARDSFRNNFLYQPLPEAEFVATYRRVAPFLVPEFVRIAEADGGIAGFVFAIPDVEGIAKSGSRASVTCLSAKCTNTPGNAATAKSFTHCNTNTIPPLRSTPAAAPRSSAAMPSSRERCCHERR